MYILTVEDSFSSAHQLNGYRGKCENLHGHNWRVVLSVKGSRLDKTGLLVDFHELKAMLREVLTGLDHKNLNDVPPFTVINPSSENIAAFIAGVMGQRLAEKSPDIELDSVVVWESDTSRCTYIHDGK